MQAAPRATTTMAQWQAQQQAQSERNQTLVAGQTIAVNKYTVQVERYLSQGGFAHVYLVRTATPVYNTTHHVLKRIAVPDEAMLTEVKKEVDIMRILKGHPNIVHLIDAASHRMASGAYEVFILMEYCSGGGIIDMMNRRLRERLTEAEILTIFVDVCEGLAAMHALKPPLLHRDLKVENILQSSPTSYKLCDFGSATPVQKIPSSGAEMRALQTDLDRHTTMQYRAPEMVNLLQRRPIDEKSDVWALGVLLYKLCYYTTPFEERGPLAIQNVNYTIPPYPVYSQHMITLISSMLREYGTQRPSVFEILNHVHALRGTKSRYTYIIPPKQPAMSPRTIAGTPLQPLSPNVAVPGSTPANPVDDLVMFKSRSSQLSTSPSKNAGVQAREKVLEAIAPMRRGRPSPSAAPDPSPSASSKEKGREGQEFPLEMNFSVTEDQAWRGVPGHKSGMAAMGGGNTLNLNSGDADPWGLGSKYASHIPDSRQKPPEKSGFENDFSVTPGFGDTFEPSKRSLQPSASPRAPPVQVSRPTPSPISSESSSTRRAQPKDAFDGLGLTPAPPPQTLGDARRTRTPLTGSALTASGSQSQYAVQSPSPGLGSSNTTYRPPSSHVQSHSPLLPQAGSQSSAPQLSTFRASAKPPLRPGELSAEERFPSLEDLDRTFTSTSPGKRSSVSMLHAPTQPPSTERTAEKLSLSPARPPSRGVGGARTGNLPNIPGYGSGEPSLTRHNSLASNRYDGTRSQQVTGTAMRESRLGHGRHPTATASQSMESSHDNRPAPLLSRHSRPVQPRRHRSSLSVRASVPSAAPEALTAPTQGTLSPPALPPRPSPQPELRDWLTGASDDETSVAVLRKSPSKRASFIERSPIRWETPLEAVSVDVSPSQAFAAERMLRREPDEPQKERIDPKENGKAERSRQEQELSGPSDATERRSGRRQRTESQSGRARLEGRRETRGSPTKTTKAFITRNGAENLTALRGGLKLPGMNGQPHVPLVSASPSGLTDNWSPISSPTRELTKVASSSSSDEGPEDLSGYRPGSRKNDTAAEREDRIASADSGARKTSRSRRSGHTGRQSSVHDLADLWGGSSQPPKSPSKISDKRRSAVVPSVVDGVRSSSPQPLLDISSPAVSNIATPPRPTNRPPSRQQTRQQALGSVEGPPRPNPPQSGIAASSPAHSAPGRTRPQSMFLNPVSRSTPLEAHVSSSGLSAQQSTSSPDNRRRTTRRTSISDMVQRYEAINGNIKPVSGPPPPAAPKPVMLAKTVSEASSAGLPSPSSAAARFPKISPPASPVQPKASLAVPDTGESGRDDLSRHRRSPSPGGALSTARTAPSPRRPPIQLTGNHSTASGKIAVETKKEADIVFSRPQEYETDIEPQGQDGSGSEQLRSPSPDKPYRGVSKLISQWQRAVDSNEPAPPTRTGGAVPRRGVASSSLRGR